MAGKKSSISFYFEEKCSFHGRFRLDFNAFQNILPKITKGIPGKKSNWS